MAAAFACQAIPFDGEHSERVFSLTVMATEVGKGHAAREIVRLPLGRYCEKCLLGWEFRLSGARLVEAQGR